VGEGFGVRVGVGLAVGGTGLAVVVHVGGSLGAVGAVLEGATRPQDWNNGERRIIGTKGNRILETVLGRFPGLAVFSSRSIEEPSVGRLTALR
jgi:hypothetical protein